MYGYLKRIFGPLDILLQMCRAINSALPLLDKGTCATW